LRAGINQEQRQQIMEASHRYADLSMVDMCREACRIDGVQLRANRAELIQAAFSGSALTNIFTTSSRNKLGIRSTLIAQLLLANN